nr:hypothetical protein [Tanacetum cinerariifolium]
NRSNPSARFQDKFDAEKAGKEGDQQYVLFLVWSFGSTNAQNNDEDAAFVEKESEFDAKKPESEVIVSPSSRYRDLSAEFKDCSNNNINEVNAVDASQLPDDPDMPELEDITYSDDEDNVGAEADFNNLETSIIVSPIPTTRVHKDHPVTQIIGDLSLATQTRSMAKVAKDQGGLSQMFNDNFYTLKQKKDGISISQEKYVVEILRKFGLTEGKSASTPIDTEKPLLKDPYVKRIFRYLKGKPHLGLWYPKDSPFDLVAYSDSDYAGASLDRKSTTGGYQFFGCRLIS